MGASPRRFQTELEAPRVLALQAGRRERLLKLLRQEKKLLLLA